MAQTTTTTSSIPPYLEGATRNLVGRGEALSTQPYPLYTQNRVAPFTGQQLEGFGQVGQFAQAGQPELGIASLMTHGATAPAYSGIEDYINPFVKRALDPAAQEIERNYLKELNRIGGQAGSLGAWGSRSQAILPGIAQRNFLEATGDLYSQGFAGAYDRGINAILADRARGLDAARTMSGIGTARQELGLRGADALLRTGALQQEQGQRGLDIGYQNFRESRDWPYGQLSFLNELIRGVPFGQTQTTRAPEPNTFAQIAGAGLGILGLGSSSIGGSLIDKIF